MSCQEFELRVRDLARAAVGDRRFAESPGTDKRGRALVHAGECAACALRLREERALSRGLEALATEMRPWSPPARLENELLSAFRQTVAPPLPAKAAKVSALPARAIAATEKRSGFPKAYWFTAVAAVLLIVFGIAVWRAKLAKQSGPELHQTAGATTPPLPATPITAGSASVQQSAGVPGPANVVPAKNNPETAIHQRRLTPRALIRQSPKPASEASVLTASVSLAPAATPETTEEQTEEVTTQFIALSYVAPANLQDGGQIVRVELPRSAMASFGLPVNMDRLGERVKADVLVSADGFARAIRFVQ